MTFRVISENRFFRPVVGAALSVVCGLFLMFLSPGEPWIRASYDNLFRFGTHAITNQVVLVLMDNEAYTALGQSREKAWDRGLHARLLNKLADDGCPLVVMDVFFQQQASPQVDNALSSAMGRLTNLVLAAQQSSLAHPEMESIRPTLPLESFLVAAKTNWGVAWLDPDPDSIVRRHWPFPSPGPYHSLPWTAARFSGARLDDAPTEKWLRYYNPDSAWVSLSYHLALEEKPGYFQNKVVFIGSDPHTPFPDNEKDEFRTPYSNWLGGTVGGVKILATMYLNLLNGDWLRRLAWPIEAFFLILSGTLLGVGLSGLRRLAAIASGLGSAIAIIIGAVLLGYFSNYWFPWVIVVGGQLPCALAWAMTPQKTKLGIPPIDLADKNHDVFISYSKHDKAVAQEICAAIEMDGIRCWIAPRDVPAGVKFTKHIMHALEKCRIVVLVFSDHADKSDYVYNEIKIASDSRKSILPFRIQNIEPDELKLFLGGRQWIDAFTLPLGAYILELVARIHHLLESNDNEKMK